MPTRYYYDGVDLIDISGGPPVLFPGVPLADNVAASGRAAVSASGSASPNNFSTPGAWVELDASLSEAINGISVRTGTTNSTGVDSGTLLQIGTGGAGAEVAWATIPVGWLSGANNHLIPGRIAAGTRVAVRVLSSAISSKAISATYIFHKEGDTVLTAPTTYGTNTAAARGALLTYSGSLNVMSGWVELTSVVTASPIDIIQVGIGLGGELSAGNGNAEVEIGYGPDSGAVTTVVPAITVGVAASEDIALYGTNTYQVPQIAAGTRLWARYATNTANNGNMDVMVTTAAYA